VVVVVGQVKSLGRTKQLLPVFRFEFVHSMRVLGG